MKILSIQSLVIPSIKVIRFSRFSDLRGYFTEPYRMSDFTTHNELNFFTTTSPIVQMNESFSQEKVVRGLHFQWNPYMGKLVRTIQGHMIDMVLDIRLNSPTFGKAIAFDMPSQPNNEYSEWIWVPPGFAHGNMFLQPTTIEYLCTGEYSQGCEAGISPFSPDIDWSLCENSLKEQLVKLMPNAIISEKDKAGMSVRKWQQDKRSQNFKYEELS